jgi:hypothetical protein
VAYHEQTCATYAEKSVYHGSTQDLVSDFVTSPSQQADIIKLDSEQWLEERSRDGFTPIDYFLNTSRKTPQYGLMYSANSGYLPIGPEERRTLEANAKDGLDIVFYQCMSSFPGGFNVESSAGLAAYETVAYWAGVMSVFKNDGYDVRAIIVDEASALLPSEPLGINDEGIRATVSDLKSYLDQHSVDDRVLVRPIADMFSSAHASSLSDIDIAAIRMQKTHVLEEAISMDEKTIATARVRLLIGQLSSIGTQQLGLEPYLDENGVVPETIPLSVLPRDAARHIIGQVVELDTKMSLRSLLIGDAEIRGTCLPELGETNRHTMRAGTTKSLERPSVRLVPNGRDSRKQVVQVPYAIPAYDYIKSLQGFARNVDLKSGRYGDAYNEYGQIYAENGRPLALIAPSVST